MTINEAIRAVSDEYDRDCQRSSQDARYGKLLKDAIDWEYIQIDRELPGLVAGIARGSGVANGTVLDPWIYQMARMCFRLGMRVQRKLDQPDQETTFWGTKESKPQ